jgi:hypothetical protein
MHMSDDTDMKLRSLDSRVEKLEQKVRNLETHARPEKPVMSEDKSNKSIIVHKHTLKLSDTIENTLKRIKKNVAHTLVFLKDGQSIDGIERDRNSNEIIQGKFKVKRAASVSECVNSLSDRKSLVVQGTKEELISFLEDWKKDVTVIWCGSGIIKATEITNEGVTASMLQ